jgi:hypothetical protein
MGSEVVSKLAVSGCSDFDFALFLLGLRTQEPWGGARGKFGRIRPSAITVGGDPGQTTTTRSSSVS